MGILLLAVYVFKGVEGKTIISVQNGNGYHKKIQETFDNDFSNENVRMVSEGTYFGNVIVEKSESIMIIVIGIAICGGILIYIIGDILISKKKSKMKVNDEGTIEKKRLIKFRKEKNLRRKVMKTKITSGLLRKVFYSIVLSWVATFIFIFYIYITYDIELEDSFYKLSEEADRYNSALFGAAFFWGAMFVATIYTFYLITIVGSKVRDFKDDEIDLLDDSMEARILEQKLIEIDVKTGVLERYLGIIKDEKVSFKEDEVPLENDEEVELIVNGE